MVCDGSLFTTLVMKTVIEKKKSQYIKTLVYLYQSAKVIDNGKSDFLSVFPIGNTYMSESFDVSCAAKKVSCALD